MQNVQCRQVKCGLREQIWCSIFKVGRCSMYPGSLLLMFNGSVPGQEKLFNVRRCSMYTGVQFDRFHSIRFVGLFHKVQTFNSCTSQPDVCQCLVEQTPLDNMSKNKPCTSMAHIACESKLPSVLRSSMHSCSGNWVAIGCAVVCYARTAHTLSAGIKCRHCRMVF